MRAFAPVRSLGRVHLKIAATAAAGVSDRSVTAPRARFQNVYFQMVVAGPRREIVNVIGLFLKALARPPDGRTYRQPSPPHRSARPARPVCLSRRVHYGTRRPAKHIVSRGSARWAAAARDTRVRTIIRNIL